MLSAGRARRFILATNIDILFSDGWRHSLGASSAQTGCIASIVTML
jgi:hypothetical protein